MYKTYSEKEFIEYVAKKYELSYESLYLVYKSLSACFIKLLVLRKSIVIGKFANFRIKWRKDRIVKMRGKSIFSPGFYKVVTRFSKDAKDYINNRLKIEV